MLLHEMLIAERIRTPLRGTTKAALLEELVQVLAERGDISDGAAVLRAVREREEVLSTAVGGGVAIPHGRCAAVPRIVMAAGVASPPVDFDSLDAKPVELLFLLVGPDAEPGEHIKALSRISRLVRREDIRARLIAATSAQEFTEIVAEAEAQ